MKAAERGSVAPGGHGNAHTDDLAAILMSDERRTWQDPVRVLERVRVEVGDCVVDLGCGPGYFTIPLARMVGNRGTIYAVDGSERMLHHLAVNLLPLGKLSRIVKPVRADLSSTGLPPGCADLVLFANVLHDLSDRDAFALEVARILKDGGRAVDIDWKREESAIGPPPSIRMDEVEAIAVMAREGFALKGRVGAGPNHYGLVFSKGIPSISSRVGDEPRRVNRNRTAETRRKRDGSPKTPRIRRRAPKDRVES